MSANKLTTAQEYVRSNYVETGRLRYDLLSQKLQVLSFSPQDGLTANVESGLSGEAGLSAANVSLAQRSSCHWQDLDTRWINTLAVECANETGINVTDKEIRIVLNSHVVPAINPLRDWLLNLPEYTPGKQSFIDWLAAQVHIKSNLSQNSQNPQTESAASQAQSSPKAQHDGLASQAQGCYSPQSPTELAEQEKNNICGEQKKNNICAKQKRDSITICELGDEEPRDSYRSYGNSDSLRTVPQSGTTMPLEKSAKSASSARTIEQSQIIFQNCFRKWFVAMVASWMYDEVVNQQVLVLIGKQGIYKTTWLEHLMPPCLRAYCTKMANVRDLNKDERMRIAEFGLINLDEIDSMSDKELNQLKSIITSSDVNERAAYGYTKERRIRIASFCASGNKREFLTDQTGNRRWLPFEVESIESPYLYDNCFPYEQIYAEALYLLRNGFEYWFELEEIEAMESHVESFHVESNEEQLLPVYFQPANPGDAGAVFMSAAEISSLLVSYGNIRKPLQLCKLSTILQKHGYTPRKSHGKRGFVVFHVLDVADQRKIDARTAGDAGDAGDAVF